MKGQLIAVLALGLLAVRVSADATAPTAPATAPAPASAFETQKDKVSYCIGVDIARSFIRQGIEVNADTLAKGFKDAISNGKLLMTDKELADTMNAFQTQMKQKQVDSMKKIAEDNKKEGEVFLAANKTKEGVVALPSGLQYKVIKMGTGKKAKDTDSVTCHYRGTLINGKEFDSSYSRNEPATFPVNGVIAGWTEALKLMPVGSKWQLFVPSYLAYGERGVGADIGPNATLIFDVELLSIK